MTGRAGQHELQPIGPLSSYQPRSTHSWRWGDSAPTVVSAPWPGITMVSAANGRNILFSIEATMVGKSPPGNFVAPARRGRACRR